MQKARWSTAIAAAALLALPVVGSAQSTQSTPQQNPPAQPSQPTSSSQPQQAPQAQPPTSSSQPSQAPSAAQQPAANGQADASAAKAHLSEARDALSQITSMPEAARLQGAARSQVSQLISDFNALITTQSEWRSAYAKVDSDVSAILGPDADQNAAQPGTTAAGTGATGTSGTTGSTSATGTAGTTGSTGSAASTSAAGQGSPVGGQAQVDPAIRAKLVEFRTHLKEFEKAADSATNASSAPTSGSAGAAGGSMPPAAATSSTSNPANPASPANPSNPSMGEQPRPTGTSGVSDSSPTANMSAADRTKAAGDVNTAASADVQKELDAISAILGGSRTGALTKAQTAQLKQHVETLRSLLAQK